MAFEPLHFLLETLCTEYIILISNKGNKNMGGHQIVAYFKTENNLKPVEALLGLQNLKPGVRLVASTGFNFSKGGYHG